MMSIQELDVLQEKPKTSTSRKRSIYKRNLPRNTSIHPGVKEKFETSAPANRDIGRVETPVDTLHHSDRTHL